MEVSILGLPLELLTKILISLPIKTLIVLRAVNKRFLSVIDDPYFVSSHLHYSLYKPQFLRFRSKPGAEWRKLHSSVDGLVLLGSNDHHNTVGLLWNPSLGNHRLIQPELLPAGTKHFALGYHVEAKDYRVLATVTGSSRALVYSVALATWTNVVAPHFYIRAASSQVIHYSSSLCLKERGVVVWTESNESCDSLTLVWFDFATQRFRYSDEVRISYPNRCGILSLVQYRTKTIAGVGLWKVDDDGGSASIWTLREDNMSWVLRYRVPQEVFPSGEGVEILKVEEWNGRLLGCLYLSHIGGGRVRLDVVVFHVPKRAVLRRNLWISEPCPYAVNWLGVYVESLIGFKSD